MYEEGASGKTIAKKQRFLSGARNAAVAGGHISVNPCRGLRLPRWERRQMVFLTESEFALLLNAVTEHWRSLVTFLVASGARWSEATALRPDDVDRAQGTVRISRAWKANDEGVRLGPPRSARSVDRRSAQAAAQRHQCPIRNRHGADPVTPPGVKNSYLRDVAR